MVTGVERVEGAVVSSTGTIAGLARRVPTPPRPDVFGKTRVAGRIPSVQHIAETNFAVLEKLLAAQKHYAVTVLGAVTGTAKPATAEAAHGGGRGDPQVRGSFEQGRCVPPWPPRSLGLASGMVWRTSD